MQTGIKDIDILLQPYLREECEERSQRLLTQLIADELDPIIKRVIISRLNGSITNAGSGSPDQQIHDLCGEVIVRLLMKLRDLKSGATNKAIKDLRNYVAVIAHNICSEDSRQQNFQFQRLKDHVRYILLNHPEFALWENEHQGWLGGLETWQYLGSKQSPAPSGPYLEEVVYSKLNDGTIRLKSVAELLAMLFHEAGGPVEFTRLVKFVAALRGIDVRSAALEHYAAETDLSKSASIQVGGLEVEIEQRLYLQSLWKEICKLPLNHRAALLLNLRDRDSDDRGLIVSLADLRIATMPQIAEALALSPEQFATIWIDLPWDDLRIAAHLNTTRQSVINLRKAARKLLVRRMKDGNGML